MSRDPYSFGQWRADEFASLGRGECPRGFRFDCHRRCPLEYEFDAEHVYLQKAEAAGEAAAAMLLGSMYLQGDGVAKDARLAESRMDYRIRDNKHA